MKTKRVIMLIEGGLFLVGIVFAGYFSIFENGKEDVWVLCSNISIGLSSGGLVALLIEIPCYFTSKNNNMNLLFAYSQHTYIRLRQLAYNIDDVQNHHTYKIPENFCTHLLQEIVQFSLPLLNVDKSIFLCKAKPKQLENLINMVNKFIINREVVDAKFKLKVNQLQLMNIQKGVNQDEVYINMVLSELLEVKQEVTKLVDIVKNTAELTFEKKELKEWNNALISIETILNQYSIFERK